MDASETDTAESETTDTGTTGSDSADSSVELTDSAKEKAKEMAKAYEDRPTVVLPGSHGTVAGTAVNDWLDDDGKPKFGDLEKDGEKSDGATKSGDESS